MANSFATVEEYKQVYRRQADATDADIAPALGASTAFIISKLGRRFAPLFNPTTAEEDDAWVAEDRYFYTDDEFLFIYPCYGDVVLKQGETVIPEENYRLHLTKDGLSYYIIELRYGPIRPWRRYTVNAKFGANETPPSIKEANIEFAAMRTLDSRRAYRGQSTETTDYEISRAVRELLHIYLDEYSIPPYVRAPLGVAARS